MTNYNSGCRKVAVEWGVAACDGAALRCPGVGDSAVLKILRALRNSKDRGGNAMLSGTFTTNEYRLGERRLSTGGVKSGMYVAKLTAKSGGVHTQRILIDNR